MTTQQIPAAQKEVPILGQTLYFKTTNNKRPPQSVTIGLGRRGSLLMKECRRLVIRNGILYRFISDLVVMDHFSRYAQVYPTKDQKAGTVARVLWKNFFCRFGFSTELHADQGHNFESAIVKELYRITCITMTHTTPYHPQGNGTTECFNRTLMNMLGTLQSYMKLRWH